MSAEARPLHESDRGEVRWRTEGGPDLPRGDQNDGVQVAKPAQDDSVAAALRGGCFASGNRSDPGLALEDCAWNRPDGTGDAKSAIGSCQLKLDPNEVVSHNRHRRLTVCSRRRCAPDIPPV